MNSNDMREPKTRDETLLIVVVKDNFQIDYCEVWDNAAIKDLIDYCDDERIDAANVIAELNQPMTARCETKRYVFQLFTHEVLA